MRSLARRLPAGSGRRHGGPVAALVPVAVVDDLEMIDVDEGDAERSVIARCPFDLGEQLGEERLAVVDAGQPVDRRTIMGVGKRFGDPIDRSGQARVEAAAASTHRDRVVAVRDPLRRPDESSKAEPDDDEQDGRARRRPDHRPGDRRVATRRTVESAHNGTAPGSQASRTPTMTRAANARAAMGRITPQGYVPRDPPWPVRRYRRAGTVVTAHIGNAQTPPIRAAPGTLALLYSSLLDRAGPGPRSRRSAIALAGRIGRPVRRPSDHTTAVRRTFGGHTREISIRVKVPRSRGLF